MRLFTYIIPFYTCYYRKRDDNNFKVKKTEVKNHKTKMSLGFSKRPSSVLQIAQDCRTTIPNGTFLHTKHS